MAGLNTTLSDVNHDDTAESPDSDSSDDSNPFRASRAVANGKKPNTFADSVRLTSQLAVRPSHAKSIIQGLNQMDELCSDLAGVVSRGLENDAVKEFINQEGMMDRFAHKPHDHGLGAVDKPSSATDLVNQIIYMRMK